MNERASTTVEAPTGTGDGMAFFAGPAEQFRTPRRTRRLRAASVLVLIAVAAGGLSGGVVARLTTSSGEQTTGATATPSAVVTTAAAVTPAPASVDVPGIIAGISRSVVTVDVTSQAINRRGQAVPQEAAGTGFIIRADGMIATNAHVVSGAQQVTITLPDGTAIPGTVVASNTSADLAVIHVQRTDLTPATIGRSGNLRVGDTVVAVGNALALPGGLTASLGIVSTLDRTISTTGNEQLSHMIQTDAAINPGDSGGPLINSRGEVIGINTAGTTTAQSIGFAISIDTAMPILNELAGPAQ